MNPRSSFILRMTLAGAVAAALATAAIAQTATPSSADSAAAPAGGQALVAAQPAAPKADPPAPLTTPAVTGPLAWQPPAMFDAGPLGKIAANGIVTGSGLVQNNHVPGDDVQQAALSNGQIFIQKADGKYQYFIQVGAYTMPSLATPFLPADKTV